MAPRNRKRLILNKKQFAILAVGLLVIGSIVFFSVRTIQKDELKIAGIRQKFRNDAKRYETRLKNNFASQRVLDSRQTLASSGQPENSVLGKFLNVLDTHPESISVLSDNSRAGGMAAQFDAAKEKEILKAIQPLQARQRKNIQTMVLLSVAVFIAAGILLRFTRSLS